MLDVRVINKLRRTYKKKTGVNIEEITIHDTSHTEFSGPQREGHRQIDQTASLAELVVL